MTIADLSGFLSAKKAVRMAAGLLWSSRRQASRVAQFINGAAKSWH